MKSHPTPAHPARFAAWAFVSVCALLAACTTTGPDVRADPAAARAEINAEADATLSRLYQAAPDARNLVARADGVLIFPDVNKVSFIVGGQHGDGVLRVDGKPTRYYTISGGSIGYQAGAQSKAVVLLFLTPDALANFRNSNGWTAGVNATVAVAKIGANGTLDTTTARQPVVQFVLNNAGLMAGVSVQGTKITPIRLG
ncbi:MAG TPA: YSC84-related protein [Casimicrobiaceae bacterium]|nr:YSC84-related protein [Casimicrobiaceae bacterium]